MPTEVAERIGLGDDLASMIEFLPVRFFLGLPPLSKDILGEETEDCLCKANSFFGLKGCDCSEMVVRPLVEGPLVACCEGQVMYLVVVV